MLDDSDQTRMTISLAQSSQKKSIVGGGGGGGGGS